MDSFAFMRLNLKGEHIPLLNTENVDDEQLLEACREFETVFIQQMLKEMRKTIPKDGLIPQSHEQSIFTEMFDEEVAKATAQKGGFGLAEMLFQQLGDKTENNNPNDGVIINGNRYYPLNRNSGTGN